MGRLLPMWPVAAVNFAERPRGFIRITTMKDAKRSVLMNRASDWLLDATKREIAYRAARDVLVRAAGVGVIFVFGMAFGLFFL